MLQRIKVAIFCDFLNSLGGTEYYNVVLAKTLLSRGLDVRVFIGEKPKLFFWKNILETHNIKIYEPDVFHENFQDRSIEKQFVATVDEVMNNWKPDIIHTHPAGKLLISWLEYTRKEIPVVATEWTTPSPNTAHWYQPELPQWLHRITAFIATCKASQNGIRNFHHYTGKIFCIPHFVEYNNQSFDEPTVDNLSVGCISRLSPEKGIVFLLGAWKKIIHEYPLATLHIYGHGSELDSLKNLVQCLNLQDNVFFKGVFEPISGINTVAKKHSIFVQPSLFESIPTTIIELMARGRVIVATHVGGIPELINSKKKNGIIVEPYSTEALYRALKNLLKNTDKVKLLGKNARSTFQSIYDFNKNIDLLLKVYHNILKEE